MSLPSDLLPLLPAHVARVLACSPGTWDNAGTWRALWRGLPEHRLSDPAPRWPEFLPHRMAQASVSWIYAIPDGTRDYLVARQPTEGGDIERMNHSLTVSIRQRQTFGRLTAQLSPRGTRVGLRSEYYVIFFLDAATLERVGVYFDTGEDSCWRFVDEDHFVMYVHGAMQIRNLHTGVALAVSPHPDPTEWAYFPVSDRLFTCTHIKPMGGRPVSDELHVFEGLATRHLVTKPVIYSATHVGGRLCLNSGGCVTVEGQGLVALCSHPQAVMHGHATGRFLIMATRDNLDVYDVMMGKRTVRGLPRGRHLAFDHGGGALLHLQKGEVWRVPC